MKLTAAALAAGERIAWPDPLLRIAVGALVGRTQRRLLDKSDFAQRQFARGMDDYPIAINTREANEQHYDLPPAFFALMLGPQRKYSCCYYDEPALTLAQAEERALAETAKHAALADGQRILELGCGWGSLSLWIARRYPATRIISVSNSSIQRAYVNDRAERDGLRNLTVVTADINDFAPPGKFDRVVSVEMFEHMSNWRGLLERIATWIEPNGTLLIHVFSHRRTPYRFDVTDRADWIAQHFFTGASCRAMASSGSSPISSTSSTNGGGTALTTSERPATGSQISTAMEGKSTTCCANATAGTARFGAGGGDCSCSRPEAYSATMVGRNGV